MHTRGMPKCANHHSLRRGGGRQTHAIEPKNVAPASDRILLLSSFNSLRGQRINVLHVSVLQRPRTLAGVGSPNRARKRGAGERLDLIICKAQTPGAGGGNTRHLLGASTPVHTRCGGKKRLFSQAILQVNHSAVERCNTIAAQVQLPAQQKQVSVRDKFLTRKSRTAWGDSLNRPRKLCAGDRCDPIVMHVEHSAKIVRQVIRSTRKNKLRTRRPGDCATTKDAPVQVVQHTRQLDCHCQVVHMELYCIPSRDLQAPG